MSLESSALEFANGDIHFQNEKNDGNGGIPPEYA